MDFKSKTNKYLNFTKEQPVFFVSALTFSYLLVTKAQQDHILEYIIFAIVMGYAFFLQTKNIFKKDLKDQILEMKINFIYDTYKENDMKSDDYNFTCMKIDKLQEKLNLFK